MTFGGPITINPDKIATKISVPTVLQITDDVLRYWTSLTCLYDRYWKGDESEVPTLPICVFHVTKISPVYSIETSNKRVILHEPKQSEEMSDQLRENVIRVISDNSVKQPTQYNVEVIVPFHPLGKHIRQGIKTVTDMITGFSEIVGWDTRWTGAFSFIDRYLDYLETTLKAADKLPWVDGVTYINMNSLEAMAASCRLLCMKMWTGYEYKFVEITGLTFEKKGNEDDVFRASLTLKERPVLIATKELSEKRPPKKNLLFNTMRKLVIPLEELTDIKGKDAANDRR